MKLRLTEDQVHDLFNKIKSQDPLRVSDEDFYRLEPLLQKMIKYFAEKSYLNKKPEGVFSDFEPITEPKPIVRVKKPSSTNIPVKRYSVDVTNNDNNQPMHPLKNKGKITSNFGPRKSSVGSKYHKGIDIGTPSGTPVYAPLDGYVIASRDTTPNGCGGFIKLEHGEIQTKFCHLRQMVVKQGQKVKKGQLIGYSGGGLKDPMRGTSTGSHLHYEILNKNGVTVNPNIIHDNLA